ncbi:hypothetical protein ERJ75_001542100 [Trypanosoma vivax]|nr:hypothetical protein ERJ75_001542100 [Trypanosoma vivax]
MGKLCCIAACLFALAAAACEAASPKGLQTADGKGLCKYAGALRFAGRYATNLAQEAERRAATAKAVKELASLAASLAAPLDGKNESVVSAVKALQGKAAGDAERELKQAARGKTQAARALTVGSGSLRSFVETVAALGTSVNTGESYSCIDGEHKIAGGNLGDAENANTITDKTCREVESARWTDRDNLGQGQVTELLQALNRGTKLTSTSENIGGPVTSGATQPECRLLAVAANGRAGDGGLLLKAAGGTETRQNTVHLGTFVKITALAGGSVSFDEKRNLTDGMNVESALQAIDRARAAVARHKAFACSDNTCPALEEAKQTLHALWPRFDTQQRGPKANKTRKAQQANGQKHK